MILNDIRLKDTSDWSTLLDLIYPVGSIYQTTDTNTPSNKFGGTWVKIEGRFLIGQNDNYTNESTGGVAEVTLTTNQIPSHNHTSAKHTHSFSSGGIDVWESGGHWHKVGWTPNSTSAATDYSPSRPKKTGFWKTHQATSGDYWWGVFTDSQGSDPTGGGWLATYTVSDHSHTAILKTPSIAETTPNATGNSGGGGIPFKHAALLYSVHLQKNCLNIFLPLLGVRNNDNN